MQEGNKLAEIFPPTGGPWGGTEVDKQFQNLVEEIFGEDVWRGFEKSFTHDCLEFMRRFEGKKKNIGENNDDKMRIQFPRDLFDEYKTKTGVEFESSLGVKKVKDKLDFPIQKMKDLFEKPLNATADHVKELLGKSELDGLKTILMVGGFSDSALLYEKIKSSFPSLNVLRPHEAVLSVVKGAVMYGHTPEIIPERVCPKTYGIACNVPFDPMKHPQRLLGYYNDRAMCTDSFQTIVKKGETILLGNKFFESTFLPTRGSDTEATIDIYVSSDYNPLYTYGDSVTRLGSLFLRIPDTQKGKNRPINVRISFQGTEIVVTAVEEGTNNIVSETFDSL